MPLEVQIAVAKINKWATRESGDTFEMVERPHGGLSLVLVDGQSSGRGAKTVSNIVARKAISLLAEGVRDGAVARAAHDYLYTQRQGKVSATLNIISIDLVSNTLVISRNTHCPVLVSEDSQLRLLDEPSEAIGIRLRTRPSIHELPLKPQLIVIAFTDGILSAGERVGRKMELVPLVRQLSSEAPSVQALPDQLLAAAVHSDNGRPSDDISVLVVGTREGTIGDMTRRMSVSFPIE